VNIANTKQQMPNPLDRALLTYLERRQGEWIDRHKIMKQCGFDSPERHPVGAYAQFASSIIRVNREIAYRGLSIIRDERALDFFSLQSATEYGK